MKNYVLLICFMITAGMVSAQALKVAANSNVGIGVSEPGEKLHLAGNFLIDSPETGGTTAANRNNLVYGTGKKRFQLSTDASTSLSWSWLQMFGNETCAECPNTARRGEVGIGSQYFQVRTGNNNAGFGNVSFEVKANGDTHAYGDLYGNSVLVASDKRLKSNIKDFDLGLSELMKINPKTYYYNGKAGTNTTRLHTGVIAQEFKKVVPHGVSQFEFVDHQNDIKEEYLAVDQGIIKYILINSIKEQHEIIENQEARIARLEQMVVTLLGNEDLNDDNVILMDLKVTESKISPNPFSEFAEIDYNINKKFDFAEVRIFDLNGRVLLTQKLSNETQGKLRINTASLSQGTYTYSIIVDGNVASTNKMIKQ